SKRDWSSDVCSSDLPTVIVPVLFYVPLPNSKLHVFLTVFVFALTLLLLVLIFVVVLHLSRYPPLKFVLRQPSPSIVSFLSLYFFYLDHTDSPFLLNDIHYKHCHDE